jgi:hypothetical protein
MNDPRFFRKYLDVLNEQTPMTVNVGDNTKFTADKTTNTLTGTTKVGDTDITATKDLSPGGASTVSATAKLAPNLTATGTQSTPAYNKGQLGGTTSYSQTYTDSAGIKHTATATKGIGFGGAGKNIQPGQNIATSYTKS